MRPEEEQYIQEAFTQPEPRLATPPPEPVPVRSPGPTPQEVYDAEEKREKEREISFARRLIRTLSKLGAAVDTREYAPGGRQEYDEDDPENQKDLESDIDMAWESHETFAPGSDTAPAPFINKGASISPKTTDPPRYVHEPISEGSDSDVSRAISEAFDALPERDQMTPEVVEKRGAEAAFDKNTDYEEESDQDPIEDSKNDPDRNDNAVDVDRAWREHEGFQSVDGMVPQAIADMG